MNTNSNYLTPDQIIASKMLSPAFQHGIEQASFQLQMSAFSEEKHLKEREKQYCKISLNTHGIFVIRETEDGWWRESIDFTGNVSKQIEKLNSDRTVACGWINQARFNEPGEWYDPTA